MNIEDVKVGQIWSDDYFITDVILNRLYFEAFRYIFSVNDFYTAEAFLKPKYGLRLIDET